MNQVLLGVEGFKSIVDLSLPLDRVVVLVGPPGGGKSNLLEAIMALGYPLRYVVERGKLRQYFSTKHIGTLGKYVRLTHCHDLLSRYGSGDVAIVSLRHSQRRVAARLACRGTGDTVVIDLGVDGKWVRLEADIVRRSIGEVLEAISLSGIDNDFKAFLRMLMGLASVESEKKRIIRLLGDKPVKLDASGWFPSPRLYSFDRMDARLNIVRGRTGVTRPAYLAEDASNIGWILYTKPDVYERANSLIRELTGLEVRPLSDGRLGFFDGYRDIGPATVSDTVLRLLYLAVALATARPVEEKGVRLEPIVLLEDPEAHVYPAATPYLVELIEEAVEHGARVVLTTHSGALAEAVSDRIEAAIYYTARTGTGTVLYRVDEKSLVESGYSLDDIVELKSVKYLEDFMRHGILSPIAGEKAGMGSGAA